MSFSATPLPTVTIFSDENEVALREHLRKTTIDYQDIAVKLTDMQEELTEHREYFKVVEDKAESELMKERKYAQLW